MKDSSRENNGNRREVKRKGKKKEMLCHHFLTDVRESLADFPPQELTVWEDDGGDGRPEILTAQLRIAALTLSRSGF